MAETIDRERISMKQHAIFLMVVGLLFSSHSSDLAQGVQIVTPTLSDLQHKYVGHKALLNLSSISCWHTVVEVVSITAADPEPVPTTTNALGEQVPTHTPDPRVIIKVRCPDGSIGEHDILQQTVSSALFLQPDALSPAEQAAFQGKVQALMGKTLYTLEGTVLYPITSSLSELESPPATKVALPRATPVVVTATKTWNSGSKTLALLKLSATYGEFFAVLTATEGSGTVDNPILRQLSVIPVTCGQLGGEYDRDVIRCERGAPDAINDYGRGGQQWVYHLSDGGQEFIYFTPDGKFDDRQVIAP